MFKRILFFAWAACALSAAPVVAAPITYTFTGLLFDTHAGPATGIQYVNGSFTLDPSTFQERNTETSGTEFQRKAGLYDFGPCGPTCAQQSTPLQMSGQAGFGTDLVTVGGGTTQDLAQIEIDRRGGGNYARVRVASYQADRRWSEMFLTISDFLGTDTVIFPDRNGGVDVTQTINWGAIDVYSDPFRGAEARFVLQNGNSPNVVSQFYFGALTSVRVSTHQVPEPGALALAGLALAAMALTRRRQHQLPQPTLLLR